MKDFKTKYCEVGLKCDPDSQYLVVNFNFKTDRDELFANVYDFQVRDKMRELFEDKSLNVEDVWILIDCTDNEKRREFIWSKADILIGIIKGFEKQFDERLS